MNEIDYLLLLFDLVRESWRSLAGRYAGWSLTGKQADRQQDRKSMAVLSWELSQRSDTGVSECWGFTPGVIARTCSWCQKSLTKLPQGPRGLS